MKKTILSLLTLLGSSLALQAQFNYTFSALNQTYTPLSGATSINGSTVWDDEDFQTPIGFNFKIDGEAVNTLFLINSIGQSGLSDAPIDSPIVSIFLYCDAELRDRSLASGLTTPSSPISYLMTGTAPNRILKAEISNAGFLEEALFSTNNDFMNMQIWFYETSHVIEYHYGASSTLHAHSYFAVVPDKPFFCFFKNIDPSTANFEELFYLTGNPAAPQLDSTVSPFGITNALDSFPASGTVYRFTPKTSTPTSVTELSELHHIAVYPTVAADELFVSNNEKEMVNYTLLSLNGAAVNRNGALGNGKNTIDISTLSSGVYVIDLQSSKGAKRVKFIKQ